MGVMIESIDTHSVAAFYVGRVIAGLGLGSATVIVPMMSSEIMPKEIRGKVGCFLQLSFTFGVLISYWVDYGVSIHVASKSAQWQIPVALQLVPAGIIGKLSILGIIIMVVFH
jgi:MFS family permease